jgi:hypothetical protein
MNMLLVIEYSMETLESISCEDKKEVAKHEVVVFTAVALADVSAR